MSKIVKIIAREILDSRGNPTIETDVYSENGFGRASVPSGASTGSKEVLELRDNDENRYLGKGVLKAVENVNNEIAPKLIGVDVKNQKEIDDIMIDLDGTSNKSYLGANAILSVSLAAIKCAANEDNKELYEYIGNGNKMPYPMMNILNGGAHSNNKLDFQEFMIVPNKETIEERIRVGAEVFHSLKNILNEKGYSTSVGDEGGFAPDINSNEEALDLLISAIKNAGYLPNIDVNISIDVAASELYEKEDEKYNLKGINKKYTKDELVNYYINLVNNYPIISIEDPFDENDYEGFKELTEKIGNKVQIVGDDLFVTNKDLLQNGIDNKLANAILIKFNQIGTVTEALDTIKLAKENNYNTIISHRSGETEDTFISDFAVGLNLGQIKTGSMSRIDRIAKYNRLIRISEKIKD